MIRGKRSMSTTKLVVNRNVQNLDPVTFEVLKKTAL